MRLVGTGFYIKNKLETVARDILNGQFAKDEELKKADAEAKEKLSLKEEGIKYLVRPSHSS